MIGWFRGEDGRNRLMTDPLAPQRMEAYDLASVPLAVRSCNSPATSSTNPGRRTDHGCLVIAELEPQTSRRQRGEDRDSAIHSKEQPMAITTCKECGNEISTKAKACPKCGAKTRSTGKMVGVGCLSILAFFFILGAIGAMLDDGSSYSEPAATRSTTATEAPARSVSEPSQSSSLTPAQRNAVRSAQGYLRMSGFSRQGLIDQLSSPYGDQYSVADATAAVNHLDVDWNEQAARSAASYLRMSGFSCQGLIDQLSSSHGEQFTREQARIGATRAGAC
jgi:hypothetical protein